MTGVLRVALGEYDTGWHDPTGSLARAARVVHDAARGGAQLVVLPEMCTTGFTMDATAQAQPLEGPSVRALGRLASESGVHLLAGVAVRECVAGAERAVNAAILFDENASIRAVYRKQRVFGYAGEDRVYTPGAEAVTAEVHGVRIALFVCYDLRFPELFRRVAHDVDAMVLIANWPARRRAHWDTLVRARAIENQCYVVAVNRVGEGGDLEYDGGSAAIGPWGEPVAAIGDGILMVDVDPARVRAVRAEYPFLRDHHG
jgi:predicted amidohydrolase